MSTSNDQPQPGQSKADALANDLSFARVSSRDFNLKALIFGQGLKINRWLETQKDLTEDQKDRLEKKFQSLCEELLADFREHGTVPLRAGLTACMKEHVLSTMSLERIENPWQMVCSPSGVLSAVKQPVVRQEDFPIIVLTNQP